MTINDIMLKSRNAALYHILYGRNNLRYAYPAAGDGGDSPKPVSTPKEMQDAIDDPDKPEVAVQLAGDLDMTN